MHLCTKTRIIRSINLKVFIQFLVVKLIGVIVISNWILPVQLVSMF